MLGRERMLLEMERKGVCVKEMGGLLPKGRKVMPTVFSTHLLFGFPI